VRTDKHATTRPSPRTLSPVAPLSDRTGAYRPTSIRGVVAAGAQGSSSPYLNAYENVPEAQQRITAYFEFYNYQRLHQTLLTAPRARSSTKRRHLPVRRGVPVPGHRRTRGEDRRDRHDQSAILRMDLGDSQRPVVQGVETASLTAPISLKPAPSPTASAVLWRSARPRPWRPRTNTAPPLASGGKKKNLLELRITSRTWNTV